jgi:hypothetical protein
MLPYQLLLNELNADSNKRLGSISKKIVKKLKKTEKITPDANPDDVDQAGNADEEFIDTGNMFAKEIFCKDTVETTDTMSKGAIFFQLKL